MRGLFAAAAFGVVTEADAGVAVVVVFTVEIKGNGVNAAAQLCGDIGQRLPQKVVQAGSVAGLVGHGFS